MLILLVLFLVAVLTGSRSEKTGFWQLAGLLLVLFVGFCFMWHDINHYPGLLSPAFVDQFGQWIITIVVGIMVGGIVFGGMLKKQQL